MHSNPVGNGRALVMTGLLFVFIIACSAMLTQLIWQVKPEPRDIAADLAAACPRTYENDLFEFEYSCGWLLSGNDNDETLTFTYFEPPNSWELYYWFSTEASDKVDLLDCRSGEFFSEDKVTIRSSQGQPIEACHHSEHGGESLIFPSSKSESGFVIISSEGGLDEIIPSLRVK